MLELHLHHLKVCGHNSKGVDIAPDMVDVNLYVNSEPDDDSSLEPIYNVDVLARVKGTIWPDTPLFDIEVGYVAKVNIHDGVSADEQSVILNDTIPRMLYENVRAKVAMSLREQGFNTLIISDYDQVREPKKRASKSPVMPIAEKPSTEQNLANSWLLGCFREKDGNERYYELLMKDFDEEYFAYEAIPLFSHYLRFFLPEEYHHPDFEGCDDHFWKILYQFLFAGAGYAGIKECASGLPELEFYDTELGVRCVSSLTLSELEGVARRVAECVRDSAVSIVRELEIDEGYGTAIDYDRPVMYHELLRLYRCDEEPEGSAKLALVKHIYSRICHCESELFRLRLYK